MPHRRRSQPDAAQVRASDPLDSGPQSALIRRLQRMQSALDDLQEAIEAQSRRTSAIQAQIDHLDAKMRGR
jgi:hypothetical protein